jgi:methionyl-tRNA synthetase
LEEHGHIYKGVHEGWYSVTDECFYKESQIEDRQDSVGMPIKVSKETGSTVEWTSEENYCFRLSAFCEQLKEYYLNNPTSVVPKTHYQDVLNALDTGLEDISISRPRSRLTWGIEVPGDSEQTIYVWFDALVNYLTVTGYPWTKEGGRASVEKSTASQSTMEGVRSGPEEGERVNKGPLIKYNAWPADVHVIGKDIVRYILPNPVLTNLASIAFSGQHFSWLQNSHCHDKS